MIQTFRVTTSKKTELVDITRWVQEALQKTQVQDGICFIYVPHTTAGITINENADPNVVRDLIMVFNKMVPFQDEYRHVEGNSPAHVKASLVGFSQAVFVESARLLLGTWQGIFLCEFDGPRSRKVYVKVLKNEESSGLENSV
jgi:secondary thiamine-phosphate synthase enzyme